MGKMLIVKTFALSQVQYLATAIPVPWDVTQKINKLITSFICNGKNKVKPEITCQRVKKGGLQLHELQNIVKATSCQWLKKPSQTIPIYGQKPFNKI